MRFLLGADNCPEVEVCWRRVAREEVLDEGEGFQVEDGGEGVVVEEALEA